MRCIPSPERPAPDETLQSFPRTVLARAKVSWSVAVFSWCESLFGSWPRPDGRYSGRARDESLKLLQWLAAASTADATTRPSCQPEYSHPLQRFILSCGATCPATTN